MAKRKASDSGALDPALTQKKRARRRLVGAIALGVVAAIVLPLLLDSEPRQTISDVQVEIPPREAVSSPAGAESPPAVPPLAASETPAEGRADAGQRNAASSGGSSAGASSGGPSSSGAASPVPSSGASSSVASPSGASSAAASTSGPASSPHAAAGNRNEPAAPAAARREEPQRRDPPSREPARPAAAETKPRTAEAKPATTAAEAKPDATRFVLQLGAYANPASAKTQAEKAAKAGVRAYTETVQTAQGARTRVRVGPFNSREAAEQSRARLKQGGIDASVVSL